jgi:hypothetical protein
MCSVNLFLDFEEHGEGFVASGLRNLNIVS